MGAGGDKLVQFGPILTHLGRCLPRPAHTRLPILPYSNQYVGQHVKKPCCDKLGRPDTQQLPIEHTREHPPGKLHDGLFDRVSAYKVLDKDWFGLTNTVDPIDGLGNECRVQGRFEHEHM